MSVRQALIDAIIASSHAGSVLYPTPVLRPEDARVLGEIGSLRQALRHQVRDTPAKRTAGLRTFLTADAVAASHSIEGFKVATVDVEDLMEGERDVDVSDENREETLAYQRMMTYVQTLHDVEDFTFGNDPYAAQAPSGRRA
jgi:negative regulator of replication initiation